MAATDPDTDADLIVFRDGQRRTVKFTVGLLESRFAASVGSESALDLGMTVQTLTLELARKAGVSPVTIDRIENGAECRMSIPHRA